ncbi:MAG: endopeptidase La [Planctomycetota bacterium]|nr:endopeptidase La [Planctomycetota bacterium]
MSDEPTKDGPRADKPCGAARKTQVQQEDSPVQVVPTGVGEPEGKVREGGKAVVPAEAAVLAVRNGVIFPGTLLPLPVGRDRSRRLLEDVLPNQKIIVAVCQRDSEVDDPGRKDLYRVGTAVRVLKLLPAEDGRQTIIVHGLTRVNIDDWLSWDPYIRAAVHPLQDVAAESKHTDALVLNARATAHRVLELSANIPEEASSVLDSITEPGPLADFISSLLPSEAAVKQAILEELDVDKRLTRVLAELERMLQMAELSQKIHEQVRAKIDKSQRDYFLQEQLKAIRKELGEGDEKTVEVEQLREKIVGAGMAEPVRKEALRELDRMEKLPTASPDYHVIRTYLDWMIELPWSASTTDNLNIARARRVLNGDHYGLEKVKRRILEYLAVRRLAPQSRGPILCFVGPPGVGKTSLGQSIARAVGRKFIRMSLGGMRDEAELRGHRRTYIGAMPGRIVQDIRKAGSNNPVFMLDEVDKVGADFRGDPTSALLEVLDPAQNATFQDHYLNVPFDLSKVMFIATANIMQTVPAALADRMEVIELPGYTRDEKMEIAMRYLVARQLADNGLTAKRALWSRPAVGRIIDDYTREAGVRELERQIGTVCRAVAAQVAEGHTRSRKITAQFVVKVLGPQRYESELALRTSMPGVATGLAYTPSGGEIIFIESTSYAGKGQLTLTGSIGEVMKESAQAAFSVVKARAQSLGIDPEKLARTDIHLHVPAGATPKDGPSAGVAMYTSLMSLLTGTTPRADVAMTGEITLRGLVLPIGGVKEKVLAARRAGIATVILPDRNEKDLVDIPPAARRGLRFVFARTVDDVLAAALRRGFTRRRRGRN